MSTQRTVCFSSPLHLTSLPTEKKALPQNHARAFLFFFFFLPLKLIPQRKLHNSRIGQRPAEVPEVGAISIRQTPSLVRVGGLHVESPRVRHVEHFPAQLQAVRIFPRHLPPLRQPQVHPEKSGATQIITVARFSRERISKAVRRLDSVREQIRRRASNAIIVRTGVVSPRLAGARLIRVPLQLVVRPIGSSSPPRFRSRTNSAPSFQRHYCSDRCSKSPSGRRTSDPRAPPVGSSSDTVRRCPPLPGSRSSTAPDPRAAILRSPHRQTGLHRAPPTGSAQTAIRI